MNEQKREAVWVFPEEKKRMSGGRVALIVAIVLVVLLIAAGLAFFLIPRSGSPAASPSPSPSSSASPSGSASPSSSPSSLPTTPGPGVPTAPQTSPPPVPDPSVATFRGQVQPRLDDATTGLTMVRRQSGDEAVQVVDALQNDAQNLATAAAPESLRSQWSDRVGTYAKALTALRSALTGGGDSSAAWSRADSSLRDLRTLIGL